MLKKQCVKTNDDWTRAFEECVVMHPKERIDALEAAAIENIRKVCSRYKRIYSGWIGGKDSIALHGVLVKSGVNFTPVKWEGVNPWPVVAEWEKSHKPGNLEIETVGKFTLDFLETHRGYLFCENPKFAQLWMREKWRRYKTDLAKRNADLFITGRRISDGNMCGKKEDGYVRFSNNGMADQYAPLAEWTAEETLAYIRHNGLELSPFYSFPNGFLIGSIAFGDWTEYACRGRSVGEVWQEIWEIDKGIVLGAAERLTSAREFLEKKARNQ